MSIILAMAKFLSNRDLKKNYMCAKLITTPTDHESDDVLVLAFYQQENKCKPAFDEKISHDVYHHLIAEKDFEANEHQIVLHYQATKGAKRVLLLGLGKEEMTYCKWQEAFAKSIAFCKEKKFEHIAVALPKVSSYYQKAVVEALLMASYEFNRYRSEKKHLIEVKTIRILEPSADVKKQCDEIEKVCKWVNYLRDKVNQNADDKKPSFFAEEIEKLARSSDKLSAQILEKKDLEEENMRLLLAVGKGSSNGPILGVISYQGNPSSPDHTVLVGKGITFDTGGLNLKPTGSMEDMKSDMAGAGAVLATIGAIADLNLNVNVTAVIASAENAIDANSFKPGDVYFSHAGFSVEVGNTDAEGRLILIDAISYAQKYLQPSRIINLATLTGSVVIALGDRYAGLFSSDDELAANLLAASARSGDPLWRMPLEHSYLKDMKSKIADIKNVGSRAGGCIKGALFIHKAVQKGLPWAHLDIAGAAFHDKASSLYPTQATGYGVRLLVELLKQHG